MKPRVLITRPREDAVALGAVLEARGFAPVIAPLLVIHALPEAVQTGDAQALLVTSRHALPGLPACDLPLYAVGERTAEAAAQKGFRVVAQAQDFSALVPLIPAGIRLLYARGRDVAQEAGPLLSARGIQLRETVVYRAEAAELLPEEIAAVLRMQALEAALFFSPRSAAVFCALAAQAGLQEAVRGTAAIALSDTVARALEALPWKAVQVSATPTQDSLLAALDKALRGG